MSTVHDFWVLASYLLVALRRALTVAWIRLNKFLSNADGQVPPTADFRHKVAIIGDGFAEGVGDWVVMGALAGVTRHLQRLAGTDERVRMRWDIVNRGRAGTTSADWVPSKEKGLYSQKVKSKACRDAEIFVVVLGTMDVITDCVRMPIAAMKKTPLDDYPEEEFCDTTKNIREICEALRSDGKKVIVCNSMINGAGVHRRAGVAKRLNRQLSLYTRRTAAEPSKIDSAKEPVELVKLNEPRTSRDEGRAFDGLHLNSRGYKSFADALFEVLGPMMIAVEWKIWKRKLSDGSLAKTNGTDHSTVSALGEAVHQSDPSGDAKKSARSKKAD